MRLTIRGFRGLPDIDLNHLGGVNVMVGPAAVGKSSVIDALRWAVSGRVAGSFPVSVIVTIPPVSFTRYSYGPKDLMATVCLAIDGDARDGLVAEREAMVYAATCPAPAWDFLLDPEALLARPPAELAAGLNAIIGGSLTPGRIEPLIKPMGETALKIWKGLKDPTNFDAVPRQCQAAIYKLRFGRVELAKALEWELAAIDEVAEARARVKMDGLLAEREVIREAHPPTLKEVARAGDDPAIQARLDACAGLRSAAAVAADIRCADDRLNLLAAARTAILDRHVIAHKVSDIDREVDALNALMEFYSSPDMHRRLLGPAAGFRDAVLPLARRLLGDVVLDFDNGTMALGGDKARPVCHYSTTERLRLAVAMQVAMMNTLRCPVMAVDGFDRVESPAVTALLADSLPVGGTAILTAKEMNWSWPQVTRWDPGPWHRQEKM